jgi:hypothetical protein
MPRRSSVARLDPRIREAVDAAIAEGRATIDELVALIAAQGGAASRSAVGRYRKTFEESLTRYREAQEVAGRWVQQFRADADGDVSRLLAEMLKTVAFQSLADTETAEAKDLMFLSNAIKNLASVDRLKAEAEAKARAEVKAAVGKAIDRVAGDDAKGAGRISPEAIARIRAEVYGILDAPV